LGASEPRITVSASSAAAGGPEPCTARPISVRLCLKPVLGRADGEPSAEAGIESLPGVFRPGGCEAEIGMPIKVAFRERNAFARSSASAEPPIESGGVEAMGGGFEPEAPSPAASEGSGAMLGARGGMEIVGRAGARLGDCVGAALPVESGAEFGGSLGIELGYSVGAMLEFSGMAWVSGSSGMLKLWGGAPVSGRAGRTLGFGGEMLVERAGTPLAL
jgi:hypothetical protein